MGSPTRGTARLLALYTTLADPEWPDHLDLGSGTFTYYGDNKEPGRELHTTPRKGNFALRGMFEDALRRDGRERIPPILLFSKAGRRRDVVFRGLIVPGSLSLDRDEWLVAIWRSAGSVRFQNYRATFSVLDERKVSRRWIDSVAAGRVDSDAPGKWLEWRETGLPVPLKAPRPLEYRKREEQLPSTRNDCRMLDAVAAHFEDRPHDFEHCAAQLWLMVAPATDELEVTRASRDGGRDAVGTYRIGPPAEQIRIDFALEAKCYRQTNSVGVRELSRLISRIRHRNFGVLVTTSFVNLQAYREIREDQHPIVVIAGRDIIDVLKRNGITTPSAVEAWLQAEFPSRTERLDLAWSTDVRRSESS